MHANPSRLLFVLVALLLVLATACQAPAPPTQAPAAAPKAAPSGPQRGGTLKVGTRTDVVTMDPHVSTALGDRQVSFSIYNTLVGLDKNLNVIPELAESWKISEDGLTYTFSLRKGVKFHDGTDFNAEAVKFNIDRILNPDTKSTVLSELEGITAAEVIDPNTVALKLKAPFAPFLSILADRAGMVLSPTAVKQLGKDYGRKPVGTGPFKFAEWMKDDHLTFERFEGYWEKDKDGRPLPYLDRVIYQVIPDENVKLTNLLGGGIDLVDSVPPKDVARLKSSQEIVYDEVPGLGFNTIRLNTARPPFNNRNLRRALAFAIDYEALFKGVYLGTGAVGRGPIPPTSWAFDPKVQGSKRDLNKAKEELRLGGQPNGFKFPMEMRNTPLDLQRAQAIKAQVNEVGIDLDIVVVDDAKLLDNSRQGNFVASQSWWSGRVDPDGNLHRLFHTKGSINYGKYSNAEVDKLLDDARKTTNLDQRKALYSKAEQLLIDDVANVYESYFAYSVAMGKKVQNFANTADGIMRFKPVWLKQ